MARMVKSHAAGAYLNSTPGSHSATAGTNNTINNPIIWMTMNRNNFV